MKQGLADNGTPLIGPNAVIQAAKAIEAFEGHSMLARIMNGASLDHYLDQMPLAMIPERDVMAMHESLRTVVGHPRAASIAWTAGYHTANYILAHRIPRLVRTLLRLLPARAAAPVLVKAIANHAWTFTGSGHFCAESKDPLVLSITNCPVCRNSHAKAPACAFYAAAFERLFAELVKGNAKATEIECQSLGASACRFQVTW